MQWICESAVRDLSSLAFMLLIPAPLFRTMSTMHLESLDLRPVFASFLVAGVVLAASIAWRGFNSHSLVLALAWVFFNTVMIGIALVGLADGE